MFLEYLINGNIDVYYFRDLDGNHYYIEKEGEGLTEIPYNESIKYDEEMQKRYLYQSNAHYGVLNYYMRDASDFQNQIKAIKKPNHDNLIKLAENYHKKVCIDEECIIYEKKLPFVKFSIEPYWGITQYNGTRG